jgi:hypothetical protein
VTKVSGLRVRVLSVLGQSASMFPMSSTRFLRDIPFTMCATCVSTATIPRSRTSDTLRATPDAMSMEAQLCTEQGIPTIRGIVTTIMRVPGRGDLVSIMIRGQAGRSVARSVGDNRTGGLHTMKGQPPQDGGDQLAIVLCTGLLSVPRTEKDTILRTIQCPRASRPLPRRVKRPGTAERLGPEQCTIDGIGE